MSDGRLTRRALIAGAGTAALAAPAVAKLAASDVFNLGLPGGPSIRPATPAFPGKGEMIV